MLKQVERLLEQLLAEIRAMHKTMKAILAALELLAPDEKESEP